MMKKLNWLLAGAALTLFAGGAVSAEPKKDDDKSDRRIERRVVVHGAPHKRVHVFRGPEAHADHLKAILQLKPNQEDALKAYLAATKPDRDHLVKFEHRAGEKTTIERLDEMEKRMAERHAEMKKRNDATRAFYAQLDPAQKKAFDAMPHLGGPGHHIAMMGHPMPMTHRMHAPPAPPVPPVPPVPPSARD